MSITSLSTGLCCVQDVASRAKDSQLQQEGFGLGSRKDLQSSLMAVLLVSTGPHLLCFLTQMFGCGSVAQVVLSRGTHGGFLTINLAFGFAVTLAILVAGQVSGKPTWSFPTVRAESEGHPHVRVRTAPSAVGPLDQRLSVCDIVQLLCGPSKPSCTPEGRSSGSPGFPMVVGCS